MGKILFIAYSHDDEEHMAWVKKFANDLCRLGSFEVLLDQDQPRGSSLTRFMEIGLERADKVLIIGTPEYKQKSEAGKGAAFEGSIISTELMHNIDTTKFYPILRSGSFETSFPPALQGRIGDDLSDDLDPMMEEAIKCVVEAGQASTSMLQRRFRLGYARAGRLIDEMEQLGIVGPHEGAKPRKVLMTYQQWLERSVSGNNED